MPLDVVVSLFFCVAATPLDTIAVWGEEPRLWFDAAMARDDKTAIAGVSLLSAIRAARGEGLEDLTAEVGDSIYELDTEATGRRQSQRKRGSARPAKRHGVLEASTLFHDAAHGNVLRRRHWDESKSCLETRAATIARRELLPFETLPFKHGPGQDAGLANSSLQL
ncbi:hypothetical protein BJ546DRAFT_948095 [Cryomyces antarcticus]